MNTKCVTTESVGKLVPLSLQSLCGLDNKLCPTDEDSGEGAVGGEYRSESFGLGPTVNGGLRCHLVFSRNLFS